MAQPIAFDAVLDEDGHLQVPEDAAARLAELGAGSTVHVEATPTAAHRKPFESSYGILAHRREALENVDITAVRREMADEWRTAGKI